MIAHGVLAVIKLILSGPTALFNDIFEMMVLYCGYSRLDYCQTIMYMLLCLQDAITIFVSLAFYYEKKTLFKNENPSETKKDPLIGEEGHKQNLNFVLYLNYAFLAFYAIAIFWSFRAYKEFKGMAADFLGADGLQ